MSSESYLLRILPETFDIHVLRTFTLDITRWIVPLQHNHPDASETINQVIYALNLTFREVEQSYRVWRNERIQSVLQHGFHYARDRIQVALWRRERGRPAATFPAIYPAFNFAGVPNPTINNPSPERQPRVLSPIQGDGLFYQPSPYTPAGPSSAPWTSPQPQAAQLYPVQSDTYLRPQGYGQEGITGRLSDHPAPNFHYPPPLHPPAHWRPPDPVPGSPPVPAAAAGAVDVAIRYLEAVNKAINICIEFDAM